MPNKPNSFETDNPRRIALKKELDESSTAEIDAAVKLVDIGRPSCRFRSTHPVLLPGQMAGANPAVRPIVWGCGIAQFVPILNG
jgi:hypothetical protein